MLPAAAVEPAAAWALVEQLGSPDAGGRMAAVLRLRGLGSAATPALERGLIGHPSAHVRRWSAHLLAATPLTGSLCAIVTATSDPLAAVRLMALRALASGRDLGIDPLPHIVRLARGDRSKRVRRAALEQLAGRCQDPRAAAVLTQVAADPTVAAPDRLLASAALRGSARCAAGL